MCRETGASPKPGGFLAITVVERSDTTGSFRFQRPNPKGGSTPSQSAMTRLCLKNGFNVLVLDKCGPDLHWRLINFHVK